jgi:HK97 family phage portal protein
MAFWSSWFRKSRSSALDRLIYRLEGTQSAAGVTVNEITAMRVAAVYAAVRVIAETIGSLPLNMYRRRDDGGRERAATHPLQILLHDRPNGWQTAQEFREMMTEHALLRGAGYAFINWRSRDSNIVDELIPLHPDRVEVTQRPDMTLRYVVRRADGTELEILADEIFAVRYRTRDGVKPIGVIESGRDSIGVAYATQEYAARFYRNDATPGVVLKHPGKLSKEAAERLKDNWNNAYASAGNARRTALLEEGMAIERLSLSAEDSQFLETRQFQRSEIAGLFRVPPHMIGDLSRATFSNIEQQGLEFLSYCILPWITRWEQSIVRDLVTAPNIYFPKLSPEAILRTDLKSRYDAYAIGRNWGWLSVNDIRAIEDLNPIADGDVYLQPLNMTAAGIPPAEGV